MSHVKGTGVGAVYEFLTAKAGKDGLEQLRAALSPEDQQLFDRPILPISWVDFGYYMRMIVTADKLLGQGDFKLVEEAARFNMNKNFKGSYRMFISLVSPTVVFKVAGLVWRQWFDQGEVATEWVGERHGLVKLTHFPDMPVHHEHNLTPSIDEIIRISGGKNTVCEHKKCILKDGYCLWEIRWS